MKRVRLTVSCYFINIRASIYIAVLLLFLGVQFNVEAQGKRINQKLLKATWSAHWIQYPGLNESTQRQDPKSYGVYHFRKTVDLSSIPSAYIIHVSADNRYRLYLNGKWIGEGPARGDLNHWHYGSFDLAPYLKVGKNVLSAQVWNMGTYAPVAQISNETAFLVQSDTATRNEFNTDASWKVLYDSAYQPTALNTGAVLHSYFVTGPGDRVEGKYYPWGWNSLDFNDSQWLSASIIGTPVAPVGYGTDNKWTLTPRSIPQMEHKKELPGKIKRVEGMNLSAAAVTGFTTGKAIIIAPHQKVKLLIDQSQETIGYPQLKVSGGKGSAIKMTYAEALLNKEGKKGNRNDIQHKTIKGIFDLFYPDGGTNRVFQPLWLRTFRYVELSVTTQDQPLEIKSFYNIFTAYPFQRLASFSSNDPTLSRIWDVGWRTARLCAGETYFDCPYYEQLQYEADTRIQALITLYNTNDDRLVRKAIQDFYQSMTPEGLTQGRYPSNRFQIIPPFSLWWVSMLHDYWLLRPDRDFVKGYLSSATQILSWFEQRIDTTTGMLGPLNWWNFVDWNDAFGGGVPMGATTGQSSVITLQYVLALKQAADLFADYGDQQRSNHYKTVADQLAAATYKWCFDTNKMEMADTPDKTAFSQHASILGVLTDAVPNKDQEKVMINTLMDAHLSQATFYYRFYLTRAMIKVGMGEDYYRALTPWRDMLNIGLTTFAEKPEPTRSDCHGWSASPAYDFLATILGITAAAPGFAQVSIAPALGELKEAKGSMPVPTGMIRVSLKKQGAGGVSALIDLPEALAGTFRWKGKLYPLKGGTQKIEIR